jgi:hypothetical protein
MIEFEDEDSNKTFGQQNSMVCIVAEKKKKLQD